MTNKLSSPFLHSSIAWSDPYRKTLRLPPRFRCTLHNRRFPLSVHSVQVPISYQISENILPRQAQFLKVHDKEAKITGWTKVTKPHTSCWKICCWKNLLCHGYLPICPVLYPSVPVLVGIFFDRVSETLTITRISSSTKLYKDGDSSVFSALVCTIISSVSKKKNWKKTCFFFNNEIKKTLSIQNQTITIVRSRCQTPLLAPSLVFIPLCSS